MIMRIHDASCSIFNSGPISLIVAEKLFFFKLILKPVGCFFYFFSDKTSPNTLLEASLLKNHQNRRPGISHVRVTFTLDVYFRRFA